MTLGQKRTKFYNSKALHYILTLSLNLPPNCFRRDKEKLSL